MADLVQKKAKIKKTFILSFDLNGSPMSVECIGGGVKKKRIEFMEIINQNSETPIFTNITFQKTEKAQNTL